MHKITAREDIAAFINGLTDERLYRLGLLLDASTLAWLEDEKSDIMDRQDVSDSENLIFMMWECSTNHGKINYPKKKV